MHYSNIVWILCNFIKFKNGWIAYEKFYLSDKIIRFITYK